MYRGQAEQDKFVLHVLKEKKGGHFLEIGSNDPVQINNTYVLETAHGWKGIMVEYDRSFLDSYKEHRPNSVHVMSDATTVDYAAVFKAAAMPAHMDYLQIDLEVEDGSTLKTLQKVDAELLDNHTFATVTFEHDIYRSNTDNTREVSREIFARRGYVRVFDDVNNAGQPYEDWYVHPDLVDMTYIGALIEGNKGHYTEHPLTGKTIRWEDIQYAPLQ